jgi:formate--tetrahydrofolate ligase
MFTLYAVVSNCQATHAGVEFLFPITGNILRMPGLPKHPAAERIDIEDDGNITGLF